MQFSGQICTSEQQSKRLIEMGINRDSADMFYSYDYAAGEITELNVLYNKLIPLCVNFILFVKISGST